MLSKLLHFVVLAAALGAAAGMPDDWIRSPPGCAAKPVAKPKIKNCFISMPMERQGQLTGEDRFFQPFIKADGQGATNPPTNKGEINLIKLDARFGPTPHSMDAMKFFSEILGKGAQTMFQEYFLPDADLETGFGKTLEKKQKFTEWVSCCAPDGKQRDEFATKGCFASSFEGEAYDRLVGK